MSNRDIFNITISFLAGAMAFTLAHYLFPPNADYLMSVERDRVNEHREALGLELILETDCPFCTEANDGR